MKPLAPVSVFYRRLVEGAALGTLVISGSLAVGMIGYHRLEGLGWLDSFLNASMILSGMGPLHNPASSGGKLFAGIYALYSGLAVILIAGIIFGPVFHRFLHRFHLETDAEE
ncbi:MAG TPA: hypothetical protein VFV19_09295 [Candidatus Polarisedimenticolaceae bacterium]|nr:hypothetical protein [Candidatus Polarisedimenticolaceae bacterium]